MTHAGKWRLITAAMFALGLALGLWAYSISPASAHIENRTMGNDVGEIQHGYVCQTGADDYCRQYHRRAVVVDNECDGQTHGLVAVFGDESTLRLWDESGCSGPGQYWYSSHNIHHFKLCEADTEGKFRDGVFLGCTQWFAVDPLYHDVRYI